MTINSDKKLCRYHIYLRLDLSLDIQNKIYEKLISTVQCEKEKGNIKCFNEQYLQCRPLFVHPLCSG